MTDAHSFERPILNSPYEYPHHHWELDRDGKLANVILPHRLRLTYLTPTPKATPHFVDRRSIEALKRAAEGLSNEDVAKLYREFTAHREAMIVEAIRALCVVSALKSTDR